MVFLEFSNFFNWISVIKTSRNPKTKFLVMTSHWNHSPSRIPTFQYLDLDLTDWSKVITWLGYRPLICDSDLRLHVVISDLYSHLGSPLVCWCMSHVISSHQTLLWGSTCQSGHGETIIVAPWHVILDMWAGEPCVGTCLGLTSSLMSLNTIMTSIRETD